MKKKNIATLSAVGVGVVAFSAIAVTGSWAESQPSIDEIESQLEVLSTSRDSSDNLPQVVLDSFDSEDRSASTSIALESKDENKYWTYINNKNEVCLTAWTPDDGAGISCATPQEFKERGLIVQLITENYGTEAYLLPDEIANDSNLIVVSPFEKDKKETVLNSLGKHKNSVQNSDFTILELPPPEFIPDGLQKKLSK